ncbi:MULTISPECIES: hypothetical protein [Nostocales]|uniref:Uncharacterized protein n=1 Tax=Tolypothrix bouteillei VB521301 TaxID=1479485 RepID=A0A8S9TDH5_9CYAN|nr:hypothetical protein [Tolypothrix bouteillei]KAF3889529.1 hypothetical protein DA73_0400031675 [Tolypothrix bouteillei VB521301]
MRATISTQQENALAPKDTATDNRFNNSAKSSPVVEAQGWISGTNGKAVLV